MNHIFISNHELLQVQTELQLKMLLVIKGIPSLDFLTPALDPEYEYSAEKVNGGIKYSWEKEDD